MPENLSAEAGAAIYTRPTLLIYDWFVLGFSNTFVWRCPSRRILAFYDAHVSANHLDVGVGTGYFLDKCRFPAATPRLALLDLNPNSLSVTARRLRRYRPATHQANVLEPLRLPPPGFDSIALNYLLHCLPGTLRDKGVVFQNLKPWLNAGGTVFGATILGQGVSPNALARTLMRVYNRRGIFGNTADNAAHLAETLQANFAGWSVQVVGCVAFFVGKI